MTYAQQLEAKVSDAIRNEDAGVLEAILREHYQETDSPRQPYGAAVELKPQYRDELDTERLEGAIAISGANRLSRAIRLIRYRKKIRKGFKGERIVEEGDSWFQYPFLLEDVVDNFMDQKDFAVRSLAAAGDLVENMARRKEYRAALLETRARVMLLSGGGNDLLGDGRLERLLLPYKKGKPAKDLVDQTRLSVTIDRILVHYRSILTDVGKRFPDVTIFGHGYDIPYPKKDGPYFGKPFAKAGIPLDVGREVIKLISVEFANRLNQLENRFSHFRFVDLVGTVGTDDRSWYDELHPRNEGFERAAKKMIGAVRDHLETLPEAESQLESHDGGGQQAMQRSRQELAVLESASRTVVLDPGHGGTVNLPGASANNATSPSGVLEKTLTLDVCLRARSKLEAKGFTVLLTRDGDFNLSGADRRRVARNAAAACFVSVHFNASNAHNAQGTETFIHTNSQSSKSVRLMRTVQAAMVAALGHRDRNRHNGVNGVLRASHSVTNPGGHSSRTAACLHEVSFMDRIDEDNRLSKEAYREQIAEALTLGIAHYMSDGLEAGPIQMVDAEGDFEDAIAVQAAEANLTVPQYLGSAEVPAGVHSPLAIANVVGGHADGSMLLPAQGLSTVDAILADIRAGRGDVDHVDGFMDAADPEDESSEAEAVGTLDTPDFFALSQGQAVDRPRFEAAFTGLESGGFNYQEFADLVHSWNLRHFAPGEFLVTGGQNSSGLCAGLNGPPPRHLWSNMKSTAKMIDAIRERLGYPVRILSAYRSLAYNSCIGGATQSRHMEFDALDWRGSQGAVSEWHAAAQAVAASNSAFDGWMRPYYSSRFVHIDTRRSTGI